MVFARHGEQPSSVLSRLQQSVQNNGVCIRHGGAIKRQPSSGTQSIEKSSSFMASHASFQGNYFNITTTLLLIPDTPL
jgi:hypothetical protein